MRYLYKNKDMMKNRINENRISEIVDKVITEHLSAIHNKTHLAHNGEVLNEMANLYFRTTGINTRIYISSKEPQHRPRIKVYNSSNSESFSLSIEDEPKILAGDSSIVSPKILKQVIEWIPLNKDLLLYYWEHPEMDTVELLERIRKVE